MLAQPQLLNDLLVPFADDISRAARQAPELLDQGILLWRIFHAVIARYRVAHPEWLFARHEDLSAWPEAEFRPLFAGLGLQPTAAVWRTLRRHTALDNPREAPPGVVHQLRRASRANIWSWTLRLTPAEVDRIRRSTEDVAVDFYAEDDWRPHAVPGGRRRAEEAEAVAEPAKQERRP